MGQDRPCPFFPPGRQRLDGENSAMFHSDYSSNPIEEYSAWDIAPSWH